MLHKIYFGPIKNVQISYDVEKLILSGSANVEKILAESDETATVEIESEDVKIEKTTENVELTTPENSQIQIPSVDKIDTYYTVTVLAYPFTQGSMKLPEGFLFSFEEMIFEDVQLEGWYLDSLFTQKATFPHVVNSDVTFYAKFILDKQCKIVFSGNIFVDELTFNYGQIIQESDIPDLTEEVKEYGYIWEGWYLDYETTQPLTFPFIITHDIRVYPKVSQMEGNTGNGETPDDTGNNGNSGTGNSGETDDGDSIISEIDFTIPVTSQEDFEFTVGTWLCEQTSKQGSLDSMIQTTTTKLVFTITETLPTSSIQAIAEKYETIVTYASQYFSSYEQAKQQYPSSMPEYEFTFDDANLTITMVASKESLNEISAGYSAITYEEFVSGNLTFDDTIENFTNSEKTALKSIITQGDFKAETIFVKIADDNSGNSGTGNSGETDDDDSIISEIDFTIPVTSQEDFEFTVGTWLCEQTLQAGNPAEMLQTTNSKIIFTITETSPTATIQAIVEKYEMIITYGSEFSSSYEQAKKQYPSSMPEYEFSFDDKNLTFTAIASKESLDESSTHYNGLTYEQFVSGYLTFGDTIENVTNSEKTILKSINNPDSNTKIETIFVKISESK